MDIRAKQKVERTAEVRGHSALSALIRGLGWIGVSGFQHFTLNPQPSTLNSKPYTQNPKPYTLNREPETLKALTLRFPRPQRLTKTLSTSLRESAECLRLTDRYPYKIFFKEST